ncbi:endonuclease/exonuclease/phosphatase family protein [Nodosilinea nodulosa]|uniref:endonuclease/exonuclease/phosphatase family protein n=1 Tax=Nodosilinea nodulosa TaxID=416001 RepID=UPI0002F2551D|nr:endonuclease/exonuclease/phosphatase family protein [Nodosilinea nodulosa]
MKIATWNLERALPASVQAERQQQWLSRIDADIWILTETHLGITPGEDFVSVASGLPDRPGAEDERWVQIWVRTGELVPLETGDKARTVAALLTQPSGQGWVLYGTVLPSQPDHQGQTFAAALATHQADWKRFQGVHPEAGLIVAGDFNQDLNALNYYGSRRNKQALRQALDSVKLVCYTAGENDPVHRLIQGQHSNTDHICLTQNPLGQFRVPLSGPNALKICAASPITSALA